MPSDLCSLKVQALYLEDPGATLEPKGYSLCGTKGNTCKKNGCTCRRASNGTVQGVTKYFGACVVLQKGTECATRGEDYVTCAVEAIASATATDTATGDEALDGAPSENTPSSVLLADEVSEGGDAVLPPEPIASNSNSNSSSSGSSAVDAVSAAPSSPDSLNSTVLIMIIAVAVIFVALVSYIIRSYCVRRASAERKLATRRNRSARSTTFEPKSPTNATQTSSATPSFPAFDKRTRAVQSPRTADGGRGRDPTSGRGRPPPDSDFGLHGARPGNREPKSGRGLQYLDMEDSFVPKQQPARAGSREPGLTRGRKAPEHDRQYTPTGPLRLPSNKAAPSEGTVLAGRNTYERVVQFAQLAAFEAPPPPAPRPQKPIQSVPVSKAVPKRARTAAPNAKSESSSPPAFYIDEPPMVTDYDILSPKTARSLAPSVASSATTVAAPGRNRPTALQPGRRPQYAAAPTQHYRRDDALYGDESSYNESIYNESSYDESEYNGKFDASNNYGGSLVSDVSSMAWSGMSGLSDESYYQGAPNMTARIPLIEAADDDDARSEDAYSDWGNSTMRLTSEDDRNTGASDASFFSASSDYTKSRSLSKELEF
ncbi:unnamed protein product [Hyaloperonospora brassicae]|uniref:EB domain-containing protein n=1 Tax=Hyaloperonospora brassicae TaxID=162125 RepID=A0AAV0TJ33_HYABA|nr:unnamed protein product [Hyaloperonospora brassicae]